MRRFVTMNEVSISTISEVIISLSIGFSETTMSLCYASESMGYCTDFVGEA